MNVYSYIFVAGSSAAACGLIPIGDGARPIVYEKTIK